MSKKVACLTAVVVLLSPALAGVANAVTATAAWLFDEGSGTIIGDATGLGSTGTLIGDAEWILGDAMFGSALTFESGEYVDVGPPTPEALLIEQDITIMAWVKPHEVLNNWQVILSMQRGSSNGEAYALTYGRNNDHLLAFFNTQGGNGRVEDPDPVAMDEWVHAASTYDGEKAVLFKNAEPVAELTTGIGGVLSHEDRAGRFAINGNYNSLDGGLGEHCSATLDEVLVFDEVLTQDEIRNLMEFGYESAGEPRVTAYRPDPADGAMLQATWAQLSWRPGTTAVSHDVYIGDSFEDVDSGTENTFQGNQAGDFVVIGFPGFPIPDGLVAGATYYWRIDDVEADGKVNKGEVWRFLITPNTAYSPDPPDGTGWVDPDVTLSWMPGNGAKLHTFYIGNTSDDVDNATVGQPVASASHKPGPLEMEKVYYWRIDEFDGFNTYKGEVWAFTTPGTVGNPQPANGAVDVEMTATLSWTAADNAASHELYFGADRDAVNNATPASTEYVGERALGSESNPLKVAFDHRTARVVTTLFR